MKQTTNIAIFVSGNGTNCENIIRYFKDSEHIHVALVISNRADAYALTRTARHGVPSRVLSRADINNPQVLTPLLNDYHVDYIVLAGFMLMVPAFLVEAYDKRIVNIHPSLLPKYGGKGMYGMRVHEAVVAAGEQETGCTVHYVSSAVDGGKVIAQARVPVLADDTPDTVAARVQAAERRLLPEVVEQLLINMKLK